MEPESPAEFSILKTGVKQKIGKHESHAVGAEALSKALAGLPMFQQFQLGFGGSRGPASKHLPSRFPVLSVQYKLEHWMTGIVFGPSWSIGIDAVPREMKGQIKAQLMEGGFEKIRSWLMRYERVWGKDGVHRLEVAWDWERKELQFSEFSSNGPRVAGKHNEHP